jgi:hypothetical protein
MQNIFNMMDRSVYHVAYPSFTVGNRPVKAMSAPTKERAFHVAPQALR